MALPRCYGLADEFPHGWDSGDPQCVGGRDMGADPKTFPNQIRPPCPFRGECKGMVEPVRLARGWTDPGNPEASPQATSAGHSSELRMHPVPTPAGPALRVIQPVASLPLKPAPPQPLIRPPAPQPPAPAYRPSPVQQQPVLSPAPQPVVVSPTYAPQTYPQQSAPMMWTMPQAPVQMPIYPNSLPAMPVNYSMPAYLTVPEDPGVGFWQSLGWSALRSVGKALGHTVAHIFDQVPVSKRK